VSAAAALQGFTVGATALAPGRGPFFWTEQQREKVVGRHAVQAAAAVWVEAAPTGLLLIAPSSKQLLVSGQEQQGLWWLSCTSSKTGCAADVVKLVQPLTAVGPC
jgi:hypothetical protein